MLENIVYFELLRRGNSVFIGKYENMEVDFIAINQDGNKYYQVAESIMGESTWERELRSLEMVKDNYEKTILTMDKIYPSNKDCMRRLLIIQN